MSEHEVRLPMEDSVSAASTEITGQLTLLPPLTHVVAVRGLGGSVLQAGQDLALPHVAVAHQQELEQKVVGARRAASVAHARGG